MLTWVVVIVVVVLEAVLTVRSRKGRETFARERAVVWVLASILLCMCFAFSWLHWGFAWYGVTLFVVAETAFALVKMMREMGKPQSSHGRFSVKLLILLVLASPLVLFPGTKALKPSGAFPVATEVYTWVDDAREEEFTDQADARSVTVQFWYPETPGGSYPLLVFSHGAFGYRMSNYSTFMELASNGYVVCSIDHPYHAFMTKQADGSTVFVDLEFLKAAQAAESGTIDDRQLYALEQQWMKLRTGDMNFVLDSIWQKSSSGNVSGVFSRIDMDAIGLFGHSMGGATAAALGRERDEIDAVIVLDGTMMGETLSYPASGREFLATPYPKPILNLFNEAHGSQAAVLGDTYPNTYMHTLSEQSYQVVVADSGHLNFTDLPLVSPLLAGLLGTGSVDAAECMQTTNALTLEFFDTFVKHRPSEIARVRYL